MACWVVGAYVCPGVITNISVWVIMLLHMTLLFRTWWLYKPYSCLWASKIPTRYVTRGSKAKVQTVTDEAPQIGMHAFMPSHTVWMSRLHSVIPVSTMCRRGNSNEGTPQSIAVSKSWGQSSCRNHAIPSADCSRAMRLAGRWWTCFISGMQSGRSWMKSVGTWFRAKHVVFGYKYYPSDLNVF